jgi:hypothetical protein
MMNCEALVGLIGQLDDFRSLQDASHALMGAASLHDSGYTGACVSVLADFKQTESVRVYAGILLRQHVERNWRFRADVHGAVDALRGLQAEFTQGRAAHPQLQMQPMPVLLTLQERDAVRDAATALLQDDVACAGASHILARMALIEAGFGDFATLSGILGLLEEQCRKEEYSQATVGVLEALSLVMEGLDPHMCGVAMPRLFPCLYTLLRGDDPGLRELTLVVLLLLRKAADAMMRVQFDGDVRGALEKVTGGYLPKFAARLCELCDCKDMDREVASSQQSMIGVFMGSIRCLCVLLRHYPTFVWEIVVTSNRLLSIIEGFLSRYSDEYGSQYVASSSSSSSPSSSFSDGQPLTDRDGEVINLEVFSVELLDTLSVVVEQLAQLSRSSGQSSGSGKAYLGVLQLCLGAYTHLSFADAQHWMHNYAQYTDADDVLIRVLSVRAASLNFIAHFVQAFSEDGVMVCLQALRATVAQGLNEYALSGDAGYSGVLEASVAVYGMLCLDLTPQHVAHATEHADTLLAVPAFVQAVVIPFLNPEQTCHPLLRARVVLCSARLCRVVKMDAQLGQLVGYVLNATTTLLTQAGPESLGLLLSCTKASGQLMRSLSGGDVTAQFLPHVLHHAGEVLLLCERYSAEQLQMVLDALHKAVLALGSYSIPGSPHVQRGDGADEEAEAEAASLALSEHLANCILFCWVRCVDRLVTDAAEDVFEAVMRRVPCVTKAMCAPVLAVLRDSQQHYSGVVGSAFRLFQAQVASMTPEMHGQFVAEEVVPLIVGALSATQDTSVLPLGCDVLGAIVRKFHTLLTKERVQMLVELSTWLLRPECADNHVYGAGRVLGAAFFYSATHDDKVDGQKLDPSAAILAVVRRIHMQRFSDMRSAMFDCVARLAVRFGVDLWGFLVQQEQRDMVVPYMREEKSQEGSTSGDRFARVSFQVAYTTPHDGVHGVDVVLSKWLAYLLHGADFESPYALKLHVQAVCETLLLAVTRASPLAGIVVDVGEGQARPLAGVCVRVLSALVQQESEGLGADPMMAVGGGMGGMMGGGFDADMFTGYGDGQGGSGYDDDGTADYMKMVAEAQGEMASMYCDLSDMLDQKGGAFSYT